MTILITGGGGFLGAWTIRRLLAAGHAVRVLDARDDRRLVAEIAGDEAARVLDWRTGDVANPDDVAAAMTGCTGAAALAGLLTPASSADPLRGAAVNLDGVLNVFEAAHAQGLRFVVYAGSAGVYGPDNGTTPRPTTHYGAFKLACEGAARAYWHERGIASVGLRPFVAYGPGRESGMSAGPTLACRAAARGEPYTIPFTGAAGFVFAEDVARAIETALATTPPGAHVADLNGETADVEAIVALIRDLAPGAAIDAAGPPLPVAPRITGAPPEEVFGPWPVTPLRDGLAATLAHYRR